jgi:hypothetical protein
MAFSGVIYSTRSFITNKNVQAKSGKTSYALPLPEKLETWLSKEHNSFVLDCPR